MRMGGPTIDASMLWPLFLMAIGFTLYFLTVLLIRIRTAIIARKLQVLRMAELEPDEDFAGARSAS